MFHSFYSDDSKHDSSTETEHSKNIIELLKTRLLIFTDIITIWGNTDGHDEQCIYETALYLLSTLEHSYTIITDCNVGDLVHGIEVVDGFNATDKIFLSILMKNVQLPSATGYDAHMEINTSNQ